MLAELARWEWAMTEVFDAADADALGVGDLAQIAPEEWADLRFALHPSARRLALAWNAPQIWKAVTDEADVPDVESVPSRSNGCCGVRTCGHISVRWSQAKRRRSKELETDCLLVSFALCSAGNLARTPRPRRQRDSLRGWVESGY